MSSISGAPKTSSLSFRIDSDLNSKIEQAIAQGKFAARSEVAIRALIEFFERERQEELLRDRLISLIKKDRDVQDEIQKLYKGN